MRCYLARANPQAIRRYFFCAARHHGLWSRKTFLTALQRPEKVGSAKLLPSVHCTMCRRSEASIWPITNYIVPDTDDWVPLEVRRSWARLIRQVYEVDPLICPRCDGTMKIIAVIERPAVIRQILEHLGLPTGAASLRAPPDPGRGQTADPPREWSYEPFWDDLPVADPVRA